MFNFRQYLQPLNFYKNEEKCMKYTKHLKFKNKNLKSNNIFINRQ